MYSCRVAPAHTTSHDKFCSSPTGALGLHSCSAFFDGGTYFDHNSAYSAGGEKVFENTYDMMCDMKFSFLRSIDVVKPEVGAEQRFNVTLRFG